MVRIQIVLLLALLGSFLAGGGDTASLNGQQTHPLLTFNCPTISAPNVTANSVHRLHAGDIKVIMAMGDSITAGFGMMGAQDNPEKDLQEYRGQSWLIGGDANAQTLATFFKNYSPKLVGASVGNHMVELCWGNVCPAKQKPELDVLNAAMSGAMMYDFVHGPGNQVRYLQEQLEDKRQIIDIEKDWKLLSIFVGANDMCVQCEEIPIEPTSGSDYEKYFRETLQELQKSIPRLYVNVGLLFNISQIYNLSLQASHCKNIHRLLPEECMCAFKSGEAGDAHRKKMDQTAAMYNSIIENVAAEFNTSDSFVVVTQPAMRDGTLHNFPLSFISTLDCFHPSLEAHQLMAKVMWNGLWTPRKDKRTNFDYSVPFVCPTADTIIPTD